MTEKKEVATVETAVESSERIAGLVFSEDLQLLKPDEQDKIMVQYWDNRVHFRRKLMEKFVQGIHYGFPPGMQGEVQR